MNLRTAFRFWSIVIALFCVPGGAVPAQESDHAALVEALRAGGHVIIMRHASTTPGSSDDERQLDDAGKAAVHSMGEALRRLAIPVSEVLTSPLIRTRQTAAALDVADIQIIDELTELAVGQQSPRERRAWLMARAAQPPPAGSNLLLVTHSTNLELAFGAAGRLFEGESLIIRPEGGKAVVVARLKTEDWPTIFSD